jgi:muconate cycloisomerase
MQIKHIESFIGRLELGIPLKMGGKLIETSDNLFIRLESEDGSIGWGEAASAPTMTGETAIGMLGTARYLTPFLIGKDFLDPESFLNQLDQNIVGNNAAKSALEMAFMDALARQKKVPLHQLLGQLHRKSVHALWMVAGQGGIKDADQALEKYQEGWRCFKVKVGMESPAADANRSIEVLAALPKDAQICADANRGYQLSQALEYLTFMEGKGLAFFEQPITPKKDDDWRALSVASEIPIGVDESLSSIEKLEHFLDEKLVKGGSFKAIKLGGVSRVVKACEMATQHGFKINLACKVAETNIATAALLQVASVLPELSWGISLTNLYLKDEYTKNPPLFEAGIAHVPMGHGLGVEVDEDFLRSTKIDEKNLFD